MKLEGRIWRIGSLSTLLLLLLSTRIVYWQPLRGEELRLSRSTPFPTLSEIRMPYPRRPDHRGGAEIPDWGNASWESSELPQPVVQRTRELLQNISRGTIYDRNGEVLAEDVVDDQGYRGGFTRNLPGTCDRLSFRLRTGSPAWK